MATENILRAEDEEFVVLEIRSPDLDDRENKATEASELLLPELREDKLCLSHSGGSVKIRARRNRLVEHSTYFRSLFGGNFKFSEVFLQQLVDIWNFGVDNGIRFIMEYCVNCLALNFVEIVHCESFASLPCALLKECISHPLLTVNSEWQVCEALLFWFANSGQFLGFGSSICGVNTLQIFEKVRFGLLPLEFILGRLWREFPSLFTSSQMMTILEQISHPILKGHSDISVGNFECFRLRLTQYSKLDLSGCQQVTSLVLFLSLLPQGSLPAIFSSTCSSEKLKALFRKPSTAETSSEAELHLLQNSCCMASFTDLQEVNISCCWRINENDIVEWLQLSSPSLRVFQAAYCPQIKL